MPGSKPKNIGDSSRPHIPLDGLPRYQEVTYLVVGRDPRDAWVSMHHHNLNIGSVSTEILNANVPRFR